MEVPSGVVTSKVKVVFTVIMQGSSVFSEGGVPV